jgi:hypothetical protein
MQIHMQTKIAGVTWGPRKLVPGKEAEKGKAIAITKACREEQLS